MNAPATAAVPMTDRLLAEKKGGIGWITFNNPAASEPAKRTLYLFFSQPGNFIAANHTGK